jgi:hypothetical protein
MSDDPIEHMRSRAARYRRLADRINDSKAAEELRKMADEVDADILRLKAGRQTLLNQPNAG